MAAKPHPGPTPKLSSEQKQELLAILRAGPVASGFKTDLWTCAAGRQSGPQKVPKADVVVHPDHVGRILHDLGYSSQKPRRVAREQDAEAVERSRKKRAGHGSKKSSASV